MALKTFKQVLNEENGEKLKLLKLAIKELELSSRLKMGAHAGTESSDEIITKTIHALRHASNTPGGGVQDLMSSLASLATKQRDFTGAGSAIYYLDKIRKTTGETLMPKATLDKFISDLAGSTQTGFELCDMAKVMTSICETLHELIILARTSSDDYKKSVAMSTLKKLGFFREAN